MLASKTISPQRPAQGTQSLALAQPRSGSKSARFSQIIGQGWFKRILFLTSDLLMVFLAHEVAQRLTLHWLGISSAVFDPPRYSLFYLPFFASIFYFSGGYKEFDFRRPERELELGFKAVSFYFLVLLAANFVLFKYWEFSRYLVACWYIATLVFALGGRFILRGLYVQMWKHGLARQVALVIGSYDRLNSLHEKLAVQRHSRHEVIGALLHDGACGSLPNTSPWPVLGAAQDWEEISRRRQVQCLLMSLSDLENGELRFQNMFRECTRQGIRIELYSEVFSAQEFTHHRDEFSGYFRFSSRPQWARSIHLGLKVLGEMFIGIVGSIVALLVVPFVALFLKLEDGGPVFYRREFVDCDGEVRYYLKFRSMVQHADKRLNEDRELKVRFTEKHKLEDDPRVLRTGRILRKFSIDELPQFFSVLQGRLAFIGPRVISKEESLRYGEFLPKLLSVKPGMTGYWQVMGRQNTDYDERIRMDMFYIDHWSLWLDLMIFAKTFWKVLRAEGAY